MQKYTKTVKKLRAIRALGFVKTHRKGPTGIGKTLEDLLGIDENNIAGPDNSLFELKSARKNSPSMLTLFTKSPLPFGANSILLKEFGYPSKKPNENKELHTTVQFSKYNSLKGKKGFTLRIRDEKILLVSSKGKILGYWDKKTLRYRFEKKYPRLLYVKAEVRGRGADEEFWFDEAWFLWDFDFELFIDLVKHDVVLVDVRIGQYPDGRPHDHGTGFRVLPDKLDMCFKHRKRII